MRRAPASIVLGIVSIGALLAPNVLRAQSAGTARLGAQAQASVQAIADSARREGLPADALLAKAAEGTLKGASEARILAAVRTLARELREARAALGARATAGELVAAATALHAGATTDVLRQIRASLAPDAPPGRLAVPLVVLADLVARGASVQAVAGNVRTLLARRASDDALEALRASVERDVLAGADPDAALAARARAAMGSPGEPVPLRPIAPPRR